MENDVHTPPFRVCAYTYYEIEKDYLVITHSKHKTRNYAFFAKCTAIYKPRVKSKHVHHK